MANFHKYMQISPPTGPLNHRPHIRPDTTTMPDVSHTAIYEIAKVF